MISEPVEILFLIDYFHRTGGTEQHLAQLIRGLAKLGFRSTLVAFDMGENRLLEGLRREGVPVIHLPVGREYVPNALRQAVRLARLIRTHRYHIVQTYHQKADTYGALIAWCAGARHLISSKRDTGELRKPLHIFLNRRLRGLFEAFIMTAERVRTAVVQRDGLPPARVTTIHNGVDAQRFAVPTAGERQAARARLGFGADDFVVGMVAGFRPEKNHEVFFAGLVQAAPAIPTLRVLAVGAGELLDSYRHKLAASALADRVTFAGDVADVVPYLWAMDVGCLTPGSNEGFSNAVIEQMATGLPMIVTDVGGNAEAVADGVNGAVIAPRDAAALARALQRIHADAPARAAMGAASRRRVEESFSIEQMCAAHARLYRSLLGAGRASRP
ncbi:MAG: glycosyltransferase [Proteobacteria bacterium]|nr:glycosyltransferase [Pseudomonadota bacterium]